MSLGMMGGRGGMLGLGGAQQKSSEDDASRNLMVNYLPPTMSEKDLGSLFAPYGTIDRVKLMTDPSTGLSKCFGFVKFATAESARNAMGQLNGYEISGKKLRVAYAQQSQHPAPSPNVFVSGFGTTFDEARLRTLTKECGNVQDVKVLDSTKHPRGVAFIRFKDVREAENCIRKLNGSQIEGVTLIAKFGERKNQMQQSQPPAHLGQFPLRQDGYAPMMSQQMLPGFDPSQADFFRGGQRGRFGGGFLRNPGPLDMDMLNLGRTNHLAHPSGAVLYVYGLTGTTEDEIKRLAFHIFGNCGVVQVDVPKAPTGQPKKFCFVHLADAISAQRAVWLDGQPLPILGGRSLQIKLK